jgi:dipeptidyl aminopeptidase/acylaminoacyl peptidase
MQKPARILLTFLFILGTSLGAIGEGVTSLDVARLKLVGGADISPNGRYIAYTVSEPNDPSAEDFKNGPAKPVLHLYDTTSKSDRVFIGWDEKMTSVHWTPDSTHLTFLSKRHKDKHTSLYRIPVDGGEASQVLSYEENLSSYSLAPDGRRVAFTATPAVSKDKKAMKKKGFNQEVFEEEWRNGQVFVSRLEASTKDLKPLEIDGHVSTVSWSPKAGDDRLLIIKAKDPSVDAGLMYRRVSIIDLSGKELASIANPGKLGPVKWSPDATSVALTAGVDINDPDDSVLFVADSRTGAMKNLTQKFPVRVDEFAWSKNNQLTATVSEGVNSYVSSVSTDGKLNRAANAPQANCLGVDVADNGAVVVVADSSQHPSELFLNGKRITNSNPWLKSRQLAKQDVVTYKARDGKEIQGILISPLNSTGPAPTILTVHGGPESHYDNGWLTYYSMPGQVAAAQGYAVFYPNYRGSTGRGVDFAKSSQGDPAGAEFDDLIDGIDYLVAQGVADKDKVGVTGGSYGGYATAWLCTRYSERLAAGVMFVGISDKVSKVGTTDIPDEEYLVHARHRPWEKFDFFAERSPIRYVEQAKTPLLIMHGKNDPRVHPTQSMELFRFLKVLGQTPVRLVLYPGEGHGNRKAAARYDYNLRMLRWFDTYLKGPGGEKPTVEIDYGLESLKKSSED